MSSVGRRLSQTVPNFVRFGASNLRAAPSCRNMTWNENPVRRKILNRAFQRRLQRVNNRTIIVSTCKQCESQFTGNADPVIEWEDGHFDKCQEQSKLRDG
jgi:hypothetical protein